MAFGLHVYVTKELFLYCICTKPTKVHNAHCTETIDKNNL